MSDTIKQLRSNGQLIHGEIWNACAFLGLANYDLSVLILAMSRERDEWTRKTLARNVVIVAYETTEDMQELLGKKFRKTLQDLGVLDKFDVPLRNARKPLDDFWKKHQANLKHLRVNSAAHRNQDTIALLEMIEGINTQEIMEIGLEIGKI